MFSNDLFTLIFKILSHIRSLFKTVALFCLATVLCPGCEKKALEGPGKGPIQSDNVERLQNQIDRLLEQHFMPSYSTSSQPTTATASQDTNAALKEELRKGHKQEMREMERILAQMGLSAPQIKEWMTEFTANISMLDEMLLELPPEKRQFLSDWIKERIKLKKDGANTIKVLVLEDLLKKKPKGSRKGYQIDVKNNASESIFEELIKLNQDQFELFQYYITPEDHRNLQALQESTNDVFKRMQAAFLECSAEEKEYYRPYLERLLSLKKNSVEQLRTLKQIPREMGALLFKII